MAKAKDTFHIFDPEQGQTVVVEKDSDIPEHLLDTVGKHLGGKRSEGANTTERPGAGDPPPAEGSAEYDEALNAEYERGRTEQEEAEKAAYDVDGYGTFDPAADGITAPAVKTYLTELDRSTVAGSREFDRVTEAEKAGHNRSSALVD